MVNELFAFIAHLINGLDELGQKLFKTNCADKLIGCFDQRGDFGNRVLVIFDVKRLRIFWCSGRFADVEFFGKRVSRQQ